MLSALELSLEKLSDIAEQFALKTNEGLSAENGELQCIPTFISANRQPSDGKAYVLDLGGSNVRAGVVAVKDGKGTVIKQSETVKMPWMRSEPFDKAQYLKIQADILRSVAVDETLPLGYCFSYPTSSMPGGDAILKQWTKDIDVPETVGKYVGETLLDYIRRQSNSLACRSVTVINDTIACLLSGLGQPSSDLTIGLIVGTGFNIATLFPSARVSKLADTTNTDITIPINLEAGRFLMPEPTEWDKSVSAQWHETDPPIIEKAVSGAYLGRLLKTIYPECDLDPELGAINLVNILNNTHPGYERYAEGALKIYTRSARLVGACLAGLIGLSHTFTNENSDQPVNIRILAEGSLFWSEVNARPRFHDITLETIQTLMPRTGIKKSQIQFEKIELANFIGSAIAALSPSA